MKGTISTVASAHIELQKQLAQLREICTSISTYRPIVLKPPIIDSMRDALDQGRRHEDLPGLRAFAESVKRDMDVIQKASCFLIRSIRILTVNMKMVCIGTKSNATHCSILWTPNPSNTLLHQLTRHI